MAKFTNKTHIYPSLTFFPFAGGSSGDHTITGITTDDALLAVVGFSFATDGDVSTAHNLTTEFTIASANTINNTGGTATTDCAMLCVFADYDG